jgi:hypothetical protein
MMHLMYLLEFMPLETRRENKIEVINELSNLLSIYITDTFLNSSLPLKFMDKMGWAMIVIAVISIFFNMACVINSSISEAKTSYMRQKIAENKEKELKKKIKIWLRICEQVPEFCENIEE